MKAAGTGREGWATWINSGRVTYCLAALLGLAFFCVLFPDPMRFLLGNTTNFEVGDTPQHVSGWWLYAKDEWRWPPLTTQLFAPPRGTHVALTDSIPLAALLFKPIFPLLWENFQYFGLWHLLGKVLQATGAVFLLRSLGVKNPYAGLAAAALALMWPSMLFRLQHTALTTHGLLLFALGTYFRASRLEWSLRRIVGVHGTLSLISLLIHPYLFAMVFVAVLATAWDRWGPRQWTRMLLSLGGITLIVALPALLLGYAGAGAGGSGHGYDLYSMNLFSPVTLPIV